MKKRLFFAFIAMCFAISGFALSQGEYVYTPQGRFQISGANLASSSFADWTGWTVIGEGKVLSDLFSITNNGYDTGTNSVSSLNASEGEGMYFRFAPTDASAAYVVSFKMKGAALDNIRTRIPTDGRQSGNNLVKVAGNEYGTYTYPSTEGEVIVNSAEELTEDWQTFTYAIQGDGTVRTWFISLTTMATTIEIADLQIAPAIQFADLRQRDAMLEKLNTYKNCYNWADNVLDEFAMNEAISALQTIGDATGQAELEECLITAQEVLDEFLKANMDDYLAVGSKDYNYLGLGVDKMQKVSTIGDWNCLPSGRGFWLIDSYPELGRYGGNNSWNYGSVNDPMGVYTQKTLDPGSYVFAIEGKAAVREEATSSSYTNNEAWNVAYGIAYIVKVSEDGEYSDTIAAVVKDLEAINFTSFLVPATITEAGTYEIGFKAYCKDAYKSLRNGSDTYVANASLWSKNENKYNQRQMAYEADVRYMITNGHNELNTATDFLADASYDWGKAELQACVDTIQPKIAAYESMDQDAIIATYEDDYVKSTYDEIGYLVYEVYQQAVKDIIKANRDFVAVNDTLNSIQLAIDRAEATLEARIYAAATGKAALQEAISQAQSIQTMMKRADYSVENAATIVAAIAELNEAVETFKTTVPANALATIVDIDFEQEAVQDAETGLYSVPGAVGSMEFSYWSTDGTGNQPFEKGFWSNGEQLWKGYLRVGYGTGVVSFNPMVNGSMSSDILKVSCDFYIQGLSGRSIGFFLKDENYEDIFGIYQNFYNGTTTTNTCDVDVNKIWARSGGSYSNASPADADYLTANPLQKTHFEVIMDYGRKSMYCTISSPNGSTTSQEVAFDAIPYSFVLQSNYNNSDRRSWFDNLRIERISTEETNPGGNEQMTDGLWMVDCTEIIEDSTIVDNNLLTVSTPNGISYGAVGGGTADVIYMDAAGSVYHFTNYLHIALKGVPSDSYPNGYFTDYRSSLVVTAKENIKLTGFYKVSNDRHIIVVDKADYSTNLDATQQNVYESDEITIAGTTYELQKGHSYVLYSNNLSMQFYGLKYEKLTDIIEPEPEPEPQIALIDFENEEAGTFFVEQSRIAVAIEENEERGSHVLGFTGASNAQNGYSFANYDMTDLLAQSTEVTLKFDYYNTFGSRSILTIGDAAVRGVTGGSSKITYNPIGAIFRIGSDKSKAFINDQQFSQDLLCNKWLNIEMNINNVERQVDWTVMGDGEVIAQGSESFWQSDAVQCTQMDVFGYINNSHMGMIDNIVIQTKTSDNYADYTIRYVDVEGNLLPEDVKSPIVRKGVVGEGISLLASDTADIQTSDIAFRYIYQSNDAATATIAADGSTVVTVVYKLEATPKYNYIVNCFMAGQYDAEGLLHQITGEQFEGMTTSLYLATCYKGGDGRYYTISDGRYNGYQLDITGNEEKIMIDDQEYIYVTLDYTLDENIAYWGECEDLQQEGTFGTPFGQGSFYRLSQGSAAQPGIGASIVTEIIPAGIYNVSIYGRNDGKGTGSLDVLYILGQDGSLTKINVTPNPAEWGAASMGWFEFIGVTIPTDAALVIMNNTDYEMISYDCIKLEKIGDIGGFVMGDVNNDGYINVTDVVLIIDQILEKNPANFNTNAADVNADGYINVTDVVMVIDAVLGKVTLNRAACADGEIGTVALSTFINLNSTVGISLTNPTAYTAFQMDVTLPMGVSLEKAQLTGRGTDSHHLSISQTGEGRYRIVGVSLQNEALNGNAGNLLNMILKGNSQASGTIALNNIVFVTPNGTQHELDGAEAYGNATGISQIENGDLTIENAYDLQGRKVNGKVSKGIYIINGKKTVK